jgi:hypothetical protein
LWRVEVREIGLQHELDRRSYRKWDNDEIYVPLFPDLPKSYRVLLKKEILKDCVQLKNVEYFGEKIDCGLIVNRNLAIESGFDFVGFKTPFADLYEIKFKYD